MITGTSRLVPASLASLLFAISGCGSGGGSLPSPPGGAQPSSAEAPPGPARPVDPPAGPGSLAPYLLASGDTLVMTWTEPVPGLEDPSRHRVRFARMDVASETWGEPVTIAEGDDFFVNWADFPVIAEADGGRLYTHWLRKSGPATYAYDIMLARSDDGGLTWSPLGRLHEDGTETEHGFVSMVPQGPGVRAFWLDGREMAGGEGHGHGGGDMTLRTALVTGAAGPSELLDDRTCECCQTAAVATPLGPVVAYRDRSPGEIRDIRLVSRADPGWTAPVLLHEDGYEVPGCPVNGPAMDAGGEQVAVAWHTAAGDDPRVVAAFSGDGGRSFGDPVVIDGEDPLGRVDLVLLPGGDAVVAWLAAAGDGAAVRIRRVHPKGAAGRPVELARTSSSRGSGFPRMAVPGQRLYVGWTGAGESRQVRVTSAPFPQPAGEGIGQPGDGDAESRAWDRKIGSRAPQLRAATLDGGEWSLAGARGTVTLLNLWATWCAPCREEMPDLADLHRARAEEGFQVVGLSVDTPAMEEEVRSLARREDLGYPLVLDAEGKATGLFGVSVLPASFLFDRDGILVWMSRGVVDPEDPALLAAMEEALEG